MTHSLALHNKDLLVSSSRCQLVSGVNKLKQDMFTWITESFGVDRFNPKYGSTISSFVGQLNTIENSFAIKVEVGRVLSNLQRYQKMLYSNNRAAFSLDELLDSVNDIDIKQGLDSITIEIFFSTAANPNSLYSTEIEVS